jgi:hypothetical protein
MKKFIGIVLLAVVSLVFFSRCKNAEFIWNPVGIWQATITGSWGDSWTETLSFGGSESGGTITGWLSQYCPSDSIATWSTNGFTLYIQLDAYFSQEGVNYHNNISFTVMSSEANPNQVSGDGFFVQTGVATYSWTLTFTGTKTSNLQ